VSSSNAILKASIKHNKRHNPLNVYIDTVINRDDNAVHDSDITGDDNTAREFDYLVCISKYKIGPCSICK